MHHSISVLALACFLSPCALGADRQRLEGPRTVLKIDGAPAKWADAKAGFPVPVFAIPIDAPQACRMDAELTYACPKGSGGSEVEIACGASKASLKVFETGGPEEFLTIPAGRLDIPAGASEVAVRVVPQEGGKAFTLRSIALAKGYADLFDGKTLAGWRGSVNGYVAKDGCISCIPDKGGNLLTEKEFADFSLRIEFRLTPGANNGIGIRTTNENEDAAYAGMEIQVLDDRHEMYKGIQPWQAHGSVYGILPAKRDRLRPCGEWNVEEIIADGRDIKVILNGQTIVEGNLDEAAKRLAREDPKMLEAHKKGMDRKAGRIGFLGHGAKVDFRDIRLLELRPSGAPAK
jgi:hypothetical protein